MPLTASGKPIEHIRFFNGQKLFASDLQDLEEFNRAMRWLHNMSLHQVGVASGYAVIGNKGDSQITVQPGYAIDSQGREIVLEKTTVLQVPPVANDGQGNAVYYDLVVSYPADSVLTETRDGVCVARSAIRLRDTPTFCWAELAPSSDFLGTANPLDATRKAKLAKLNQDIESGNRIRLARAEVLNCELNQPLSIAERRNARPSLQPYVSAGNTFNLTGTPWTTAVNALGITATLAVDTSAANFRSVPQYSANVVGSRSNSVTIGAKTSTVMVDGFVRIDTPAANSFQLSMVIPAILLEEPRVAHGRRKGLADRTERDRFQQGPDLVCGVDGGRVTMAILPLSNNFRYLNREGRWLDFHWSGLHITQNGALELLPSAVLDGTPPDLSEVSAATAPAGVAADGSGRVFYSDPDSNQIYSVGGCSTEAAPLVCLVEGMGLAPLNQPRGLLLLEQRQRLVVVDSGNHRILFFDTAEFALRDVWGPDDVAAVPAPGSAPGQFNTPWTISADGEGNLYVLDYGNQRIQKFRETGEPELSFTTKLQQSLLIKTPGALAVRGEGQDVRVFVFDIDTHTIFVFDGDGATILDNGQPATIPATLGVIALAASSDVLYVGDNQLRRVLAYQIVPGFPSSGAAVGFDGPVAALATDPLGGLEVLPGAVSSPLHLNVSGAFVSFGVLWSDAVSAGTQAVVWSRLRAEVSNADGAHVEFRYASSNSAIMPPVAPAATNPFSDSQWTALPNDVEDFWLGGDKVEYLFVGAVFRSDRSGTPSLKQMRATFNDSGYLPYLPAIYRQPLASRGNFLPRFLSLFQGVFDDIEGEVDSLARYFNPYAAPVEALPWLATWLAVDLEQGEPVPQIRTAIARAFHRYQWRGTAEGLRLALLEDAGIHAIIVQPIASASFWNFPGDTACSGVPSTASGINLGATSRLPDVQPGGAVLGSTAQFDRSYLIEDAQFGEPLFAEVAYQFVVEVYSSEIAGKGRRELVHQIVEREKPAHTMWRLAVIEASMRVGVQARAGIDSIVAGITGPSALGVPGTSGGVRLGGTPSPRVGASRLGQNLKLDG